MLTCGQNITIQGRQVILRTLLGKGKSGYSWLADTEEGPVVLKALHNEPNPYYRFEHSKYRHEMDAYQVLQAMGIAIPELLAGDPEQDMLLKQYVPGMVAGDAIAGGQIDEDHLQQLAGMFIAARVQGRNLDYFPMNFVINPSGRLIYIDYEVNPFTTEWNLWNWGIFYWLNSDGMARFIDTRDPVHINIRADSGIPIKTGFENSALELRRKYDPE